MARTKLKEKSRFQQAAWEKRADEINETLRSLERQRNETEQKCKKDIRKIHLNTNKELSKLGKEYLETLCEFKDILPILHSSVRSKIGLIIKKSKDILLIFEGNLHLLRMRQDCLYQLARIIKKCEKQKTQMPSLKQALKIINKTKNNGNKRTQESRKKAKNNKDTIIKNLRNQNKKLKRDNEKLFQENKGLIHFGRMLEKKIARLKRELNLMEEDESEEKCSMSEDDQSLEESSESEGEHRMTLTLYNAIVL
eukprot:79331_1